jgi:membrane protein
MIALVYLYLTASIFVYGGELNAAIGRVREAKQEIGNHPARSG